MITSFRDRSRQSNLLTAGIALAVLALAFLLGQRASALWLGLLVAALGALVLLIRPALGLLALVAAALLLPLEFSTGTEVKLNPAALLIPALVLLWLLDSVRRRRIHVVASRLNLPLALFLGAGLLSLVIGQATWDSSVPIKSNFVLVQLAQWAIFAFSALVFWLTANLITHEQPLRRLTAFFLLVAGSVAIVRILPGTAAQVERLTTAAFIRAPLWVLLTALAGGQLIWNHRLRLAWRVFLVAVLSASVVYAFVDQREALSNWVGLGAVFAVLVWLRFPRLRWPLVALVLLMAVAGLLFPTLYDFAGGDAEWAESGASRLILIERVVDVTLRNPITGLGPAAYRPYASLEPLEIPGNRLWFGAVISSHNNYVDLFAHVGVVGLALFGWFVVEVGRLSGRLRQRYRSGFAAGYVNGMLAAGVASLVIMLMADWILPFVYNIGFQGFQASVLVWLFLGGLVVLENMGEGQETGKRAGEDESR
ncbi:MAG: O-antigen ligase family protein [Anaerolineales bacterium]|nr:O-antigen ligase family protein [Anaerolineales bacterium]